MTGCRRPPPPGLPPGPGRTDAPHRRGKQTMRHRRVIIALALAFVALLAGEVGYRHFVGSGQSGSVTRPVEVPVAQVQSGQGIQGRAQSLFEEAVPDRQSPMPPPDVVPVASEGANGESPDQTAALGSQPQADAGQFQTSVRSVIDNQNPFDQQPVARVATRLNVPQAVTGRYQSREALALDWNDVPGADAYQVRVWDEAGVRWSVLPNERFQVAFDGSQARVQFSFQDSFDLGFSMKSRLLFSVKAVGDTGGSSWSQPIDIDLILDTPRGLWSRLSGDRIRLDWQDIPLADFYEVRFRSNAHANAPWIMLSEAEDIEWSIDGSSANIGLLPDSETYSFQVRAITGDYKVCSVWADVLATPPGTEPGTPPGIEPTPETSTENTLGRTSRQQPTPTPQPTPSPTTERTTGPNPSSTPSATPDTTTTTGGTTGPGTGPGSRDDQLVSYYPDRVNVKHISKNKYCVDIDGPFSNVGPCDENEDGDTSDIWKNGKIHLSFDSENPEIFIEVCLDVNADADCPSNHKVNRGSEFQFSFDKDTYFEIKNGDPDDEVVLDIAVGFTGQPVVYYGADDLKGMVDLEDCRKNIEDLKNHTTKFVLEGVSEAEGDLDKCKEFIVKYPRPNPKTIK